MTTMNGLDLEQLTDIVKSVKSNWETGKTVWKATAKWIGGFQVETGSRDYKLYADEPEMLGGSDTAPNPVEIVLQAYGACLAIGYALNAAVKGIKIHELSIELEGEIDLPGFLGLEPPEELHMDRLPGYKSIKVTTNIKADADKKTLQDLHQHVVRTSPVGVTLERPVAITTELKVA